MNEERAAGGRRDACAPYKYGAMGRRMARVGPSGTDFFFYDMNGRLLPAYPWGNPSQPERAVYFAGQKLGRWADRLGSVRRTVGGVVNHYYPYGELVIGNNNTGFKFAETYRDDSGLDYALNRYYASSAGRFLSVDSGRTRAKSPQSFNRYAYSRNDPINARDPGGRDLMYIGPCAFDVSWAWEGSNESDDDIWAFLGCETKSMSDPRSERPGGGGGGGGWVDEGGGGSPVRVTSPASNWDQASTQLGLARDTIINMNYSQSCKDTLALVGVTTAQLVQAAGAAQFNDAMTSSETRASLYANTGAAGAAAGLYGSQTISEWFSSDSATMAAADLNGSRIFFRSSGVDASGAAFNASLVGHELLHNITGVVDEDLKPMLGIVPSRKSEWITDRLYGDCFRR